MRYYWGVQSMGLGISWVWSMKEMISQGQVLVSHLQNTGVTGLFPDILNIGREAGLVEKS